MVEVYGDEKPKRYKSQVGYKESNSITGAEVYSKIGGAEFFYKLGFNNYEVHNTVLKMSRPKTRDKVRIIPTSISTVRGEITDSRGSTRVFLPEGTVSELAAAMKDL